MLLKSEILYDGPGAARECVPACFERGAGVVEGQAAVFIVFCGSTAPQRATDTFDL
ncbi:hypothetical protein ACFUCQ_25620 [Streptomyces sp. NPDC057197]|uniref:hypothetical protein n=1 Tax=Streptomyces sp. NPDC057197 TaxID=3346045 RepID=UPI003642B0FA